MTITKSNGNEDVKLYSLSDVALRNGSDMKEVWIIIKDSVYDCTKYLDDHPGGPELITEWGGMDCTKAFNDAGHSTDAFKDLKRWKIGELIEEDRKANRGKAKTFSSGKIGDAVKQKKKFGGFLFC